jgi:hypothetical protein
MCTVFVLFNFLGAQLSDLYGYNGRHFNPQKLGYGKKVWEKTMVKSWDSLIYI